jgi:hypothetical protein
VKNAYYSVRSRRIGVPSRLLKNGFTLNSLW